jgi:TolB-like protein
LGSWPASLLSAALAAFVACGSPPAPPPAPQRVAPESTALSFDEAVDRLASRFALHGGRVAILDFTDLARRQTQLGQLISQSLTTSLVTSKHDPRLRVLERLQVDQVLRELNFASANATEDDVEHIGRALNADALIFGTAVPAGRGIVIVNARMVEVAGRTIIDAARVTARIPPGVSLAALPQPAAATSTPVQPPTAADQSDDAGAPVAQAVAASIPKPSPASRLTSLVTIDSATWIFVLEQCGGSSRAADTRVTCDVTVTNWGAPAVLALFFDRALSSEGYTRAFDEKGAAYAPSRVRFSPSGEAYSYASYPAPALSTRDDVRQYPTHAPVHLTLEMDGVPSSATILRTVELVGGSMPLGYHDVVVTFHDVPIRR